MYVTCHRREITCNLQQNTSLLLHFLVIVNKQKRQMYSVLNNKLSHKIAKPNKTHKNTFSMYALQYNTDIDKQKQLMNMCLNREGIHLQIPSLTMLSHQIRIHVLMHRQLYNITFNYPSPFCTNENTCSHMTPCAMVLHECKQKHE